MPLVTPLRQSIDLPVSDRVFHDTRVRQKACFLSLRHEQQPDGQCSAYITVVVHLYAATEDGYGPAIDGPGFAPYSVVLVADNNTIVEASTGSILRIRAGESNAEWAAAAEAYEQAVMLQGDFFELLRRYSPIDIEEMIIGHIQAADAMGRFA